MPACTGTLWTWSGFLFLRFSTFYRVALSRGRQKWRNSTNIRLPIKLIMDMVLVVGIDLPRVRTWLCADWGTLEGHAPGVHDAGEDPGHCGNFYALAVRAHQSHSHYIFTDGAGCDSFFFYFFFVVFFSVFSAV